MFTYQFETRQQDQDFLAGKPVVVTFAMRAKDTVGITPQASIVVQLTNRSKYKGQITAVSSVLTGELVSGELTIRRI